MDNEIIKDLKNEFYCETKEKNITIEDLKKAGVSELVIKSEIYLKKLYGEDIILIEEAETSIDLSKKKIEKVDLSEINKISEFTKKIDDVSNTDFDRFVEIINSKASKD